MAEGLQGLIREKASGRRAAITKAIETIGGKVEAVYYTFGDYDCFVIADAPDNVAAAAVSIKVSAAGLLRARVTPLLTVDETDQAVQRTIEYRPPGA